MSRLMRTLIKISGNRYAQGVLEKTVRTSQYLMGIGSGSEVSLSGEGAVFQVVKRRHGPPYCIFDVGSNKGQFLGLALSSIGAASVSVHCFEPGHETYGVLSAAFGHDHRVALNNFGIGATKGDAVLHYDAAGSGMASLTRRRLDHFHIDFGKSERVQIDTIDNYCAANAIDHIHLLKIDIEGHELDALAGAKEMFAKRAVDIVTFEFGGCNIDTRTYFQDFWYLIREIDMKIYRITPSGYLHPIESYRELDEQFRTTNYVAMR
jgi:FkbM family methyltransferase